MVLPLPAGQDNPAPSSPRATGVTRRAVHPHVLEGAGGDHDSPFALPPASPQIVESPRHDGLSNSADDDDMRCKRAQSTLASGFYSVGVGAPRATGGASVSAALSPSLRFLEHLTMEISVLPGYTHARSKKQFPMTVHHSKTKASWRHCHSYDDYRDLQTRLLTLMEQGHFCMAECPWLYTFLRRSFPKPPPLFPFGLIGNDKAAEERRYALMRTLATLQSVLLNPDNHSCEVLRNGVATELVAFLYGETVDQVNNKQSTTALSPVVVRPWEVASPVGGAVRGFSASLGGLSDVGDAMEDVPMDTPSSTEPVEPQVCCAMCALGEQHPDAQVLASWNGNAHQLHTPTLVRKPTLTLLRTRSSSTDTMMLSQYVETPTDSTYDYPTTPGTPRTPPPPLVPENAVLSPKRSYHTKEPRTSKRFSALGASTVSMFHSLRQRIVSPNVQGSYVA